VVSRILVTAAWVCCLLVLASFTLFVHDQLVTGSKHQQALVSSTTVATPANTPHKAGQPRRFIVGAAHDLTSPFDSIVASDNAWVNHGLPTVIGLLLYGAGLGFAARFTKGLS
jgi:hypothetical protein